VPVERLPWFPFYAADWLADEKVQLMTAEQRGAYIHLLAYQWREGSVPADPLHLAQLAAASPDAIQVLIAQDLFPLFGRRDRGQRRRNSRLERVRKEQELGGKKRTAKAKHAAQTRWGKDLGDAPSIGQALPGDATQTQTQTQNQNQKRTDVGEAGKVVACATCFEQGEHWGLVKHLAATKQQKTCKCPRGRERAKRFAQDAERKEAQAPRPKRGTRPTATTLEIEIPGGEA
jgi:uncharacterized protein YdaU (DUF1376 family)